MDYEDDDYDRYQQEEDELYKDESENSEASDEVDSELEDTLMGHIHYSTNVYQKIGKATTKASASTPSESKSAVNSITSSTTSAPKNGHLAASGAEDYFRAVNQGSELDDGSDLGLLNSRQQQKSLSSFAPGWVAINDNKINEKKADLKEEEESRYSVEKKRKGNKKNSSSHFIIDDSGSEDSEAESLDSDMSMSDDGSNKKLQTETIEREEGEHIEEDELQQDDESKDEDEREEGSGDSLNEHVLEIGSTAENSDDDVNDYDLEKELGHLEDEEFKCTVCGAKDEHVSQECPLSVCFNCNKKGHIAEKCPKPRGYGRYADCRKCGSTRHATEDCPTVWRTYVVKSTVPLTPVVAYCYNCGAVGHFGDDCNMLRPMYARGDTASAFNMSSIGRSGQPGSTRDAPGVSSSSASNGRSRDSSSRSRHQDYDDRDSNRYRPSPRDESRRDWDRDGGRDSPRHGSSSSRSNYDTHDRDRTRDKERERERDRQRDRDRERDRDRSSRRERNYRDRDSEPSSSDRGGRGREDRRYDDDDNFDPRDPRSSRRRRNNDSRSPPALSRSSESRRTTKPLEGKGSQDSPLRIGSESPQRITFLKAATSTAALTSGSSSPLPQKLHPSLPDTPSRGSPNGGKKSFAEMNAFPRGNSGGSTSSTPNDGADRPMYTGGYSQRR
ncbi:hypothetical protein BGZ83_006942 [Gryganskiella cystojenkinii]|nr:hypothetical protein BGZ83_006942 [Gryganskiella cystojenkinii]